MKNSSIASSDVLIANEQLYKPCGLQLTDFKVEEESIEYEACRFKLNELSITYRAAKITPTKIGQFVTIWKRNDQGITEPFHSSDDIDAIIISVRNGENFGQFIFPKTVLVDKGIISTNEKEGKRGIRVYAPWDKTINKQAITTQSWQTNYFVSIKNNQISDNDLVRTLLLNSKNK